MYNHFYLKRASEWENIHGACSFVGDRLMRGTSTFEGIEVKVKVWLSVTTSKEVVILDCIWTLTRLDVIVKSIPQLQRERDRKFVCVTSRSCEKIAFTSHTWLSDRNSPLQWERSRPGYPQVTMPWHHRAMTLHGHTWQCATEALQGPICPPDCPPDLFFSKLSDRLTQAADRSLLVVLGDLNAKHRLWDDNSVPNTAGTRAAALFDDFTLTQTVMSPTRFSPDGQSSSVLDLFCHRPSWPGRQLACSTEVGGPISDHCYVTSLMFQQWSIGGLRQSVRKFRKEQVRRAIRRADWTLQSLGLTIRWHIARYDRIASIKGVMFRVSRRPCQSAWA